MEEKTQAQKEKSPKRKHVGLIVFACAVLLAIILAVCLTGTPRHAITLPTGSADVSAGKEQAGYQLKDTNITVDNVQQVIASMKRPSSYSASVANTLYWSGSWQKINATTYVRDGVSVTEYKNAQETADHYIAIRDNLYYAWRNGSTAQYTASTGSISADDTSMIPTYETVVSANKQSISAAGERTVNGESCIYVTVQADNGYSLTYWVSTVSGLLIQADYTKEGDLVRSVVLDNIQSKEPDDAWFQLPDGTNLLEKETANG